MGYEAFICCYFDQEDLDCVGVHIVFIILFGFAMSFCGEFSAEPDLEWWRG
jgi:hypothetical protein